MKRILLLFIIAFNTLVAADCSRELTLLGREVQRDQQWVEAIFKEANCSARQLPSAKRIIDRLWSIKTGQVDLLSAATPLAERLEFARFSIPYDREQVVLIGLSDFVAATPINGLDDVLTKNITLIGPISGYFGPDWERLKSAFKSRKQLLDYSNWLPGASLLIRHPRSLMLITADAAEEAIARSPKKLAVHPVVLYQTDVVLMFSRKTVAEADIATLNEAIKRLQARRFVPTSAQD